VFVNTGELQVSVWLQPCINDIDHFIIPTNAHNVKNVELLKHVNTFTAIVDLSRSNFSIARAPLFQLKSAT